VWFLGTWQVGHYKKREQHHTLCDGNKPREYIIPFWAYDFICFVYKKKKLLFFSATTTTTTTIKEIKEKKDRLIIHSLFFI
jgi:hypothetical protein